MSAAAQKEWVLTQHSAPMANAGGMRDELDSWYRSIAFQQSLAWAGFRTLTKWGFASLMIM